MLRFLRIRRLAVIDSVEVEFDPGLNVLTGETGAGKSILVEAVGLLLGGRASGDLVRTGEDSATIEAIFESGGEELLVRREITAQGRSRAFVNGELTTAGALKDLSSRLIELHGQHEHQTLLDPSTHLGVLDAFAASTAGRSCRAGIRPPFVTRRTNSRSRDCSVSQRTARQDLAQFQLAELERGGAQTWRGRGAGRGQADSGATPSASSVSARRRTRRSTNATTRCWRCSAASGGAWGSWPPSTRSSALSGPARRASSRSSTISRSFFGAMRTASRRRRPDFSRSRTVSRSSSD